MSDQIQLLEDELGARLFVRSRQGFVLTAAGEALFPYAQCLLATAEDAQAAVRSVSQSGDDSLVIGALETVAREILPPVLAAVRENQPDIRIRIEVGGSGQLVQRVLDGSNDIAFCISRGERDHRLVRREFARERLILIARWSTEVKAPADTLEALTSQLFIATEPGCVYRHLFDQAWREAGVTPPRPFTEVGSIEAIVRLVAAGSGYGLVPQIAAQAALERGEVMLLPFPGVESTATLDMVWRRRRVQLSGVSSLLAELNKPELLSQIRRWPPST